MAKSILIINEDEEEIKELQDFFTAEGSTVFCVKTVDDAIACFANNDLCLIILDVDISVEDDHRLLRVMRKSKNTPILVLSSQSEHKHRLETLKAGAHAYMCPPYSLEECLAQAQSLMQMYMESHPNEHIERKQKELEKLNKKMDNYLDMRSDGEISKEIFLAKTDEIQKKMKQIKEDILTLQPKEEPKVERDYAADLARLRVELESYTNFENETVIPDSILEAFIEKIVVCKDSFDWHLRINGNADNTTSKEFESEFEEAVSIIDAPETIEQSEDKLLIASFVLTIEDAKKYMYSIDTKKRVHRWKNITVNLYT